MIWSQNYAPLGSVALSALVALLPVAYTVGDDFKPGTRRPAEEITYFNGWKRSG